ncbi:MAG: hypothetical protein OXG24_09100 [Gammaproteobacteria bacterium]|nr:hypothetical protein [Gammaproteobacteria bacterium]
MRSNILNILTKIPRVFRSVWCATFVIWITTLLIVFSPAFFTPESNTTFSRSVLALLVLSFAFLVVGFINTCVLAFKFSQLVSKVGGDSKKTYTRFRNIRYAQTHFIVAVCSIALFSTAVIHLLNDSDHVLHLGTCALVISVTVLGHSLLDFWVRSRQEALAGVKRTKFWV